MKPVALPRSVTDVSFRVADHPLESSENDVDLEVKFRLVGV